MNLGTLAPSQSDSLGLDSGAGLSEATSVKFDGEDPEDVQEDGDTSDPDPDALDLRDDEAVDRAEGSGLITDEEAEEFRIDIQETQQRFEDSDERAKKAVVQGEEQSTFGPVVVNEIRREEGLEPLENPYELISHMDGPEDTQSPRSRDIGVVADSWQEHPDADPDIEVEDAGTNGGFSGFSMPDIPDIEEMDEKQKIAVLAAVAVVIWVILS